MAINMQLTLVLNLQVAVGKWVAGIAKKLYKSFGVRAVVRHQECPAIIMRGVTILSV